MFKLIILASAMLMPWKSIAQTSKKENRADWSKTRPDAVRQGQMLHMAKQLSVGDFLAYYLDNGKQQYTKMHGPEKMGELYADSPFIYFGHHTGSYMIRFMKVRQEELAGLNYNDIDGREIRDRFIREIVPEKDRRDAERKEDGCSMSSLNYDFKYDYEPATRSILISYRWKISCEFLYKIINKTYSARYHFDSKTFTDPVIVNHRKK